MRSPKKTNASKKRKAKRHGRGASANSTKSKKTPTLAASATFRVKSTLLHGINRQLTVVSARGKESIIRLPRLALVGPSDSIYVDPANSTRISVRSAEDPSDLIPVVPNYQQRDHLRLGGVDYEISIREIHSQSDLDDYEYLEGFHYKSSSAIVAEEGEPEKGQLSLGGRKAVLLAYIKIGKRRIPAGYIELQMPLLMCKPRHVLFAHGFHHPSRPVSWDEWDVPSMREYVNLIVRIARVVTSPELRGLGMSRLLINAARKFAKERWHIRGRRPLFLEISAEMLKYMDFATSAGLHFLGNTEGNLKRIHKDLIAMNKGQKITSGIMTLQKKYLTKLKHLSEVLRRPFQEVLSRLKEITANENGEDLRNKLNRLRPEEWYLFKTVLRFPIPYFMSGLDEASESFVSAHASRSPPRVEGASKIPHVPRIELKDIRVSSTYEIPDSVQARAVRECFGLDGDTFKITLVGPLSLEASAGNILLLTGASGSGKSVLLRVLDPNHQDDMLDVSFRDKSNQPYKVAWMRDIRSEKPLIQHFSEKWGMESSISALNQAGLSEAFVYLLPYKLLSRGQQYRARLAALSLGPEQVWLMDEFGADLDPFTARIVASNLRKHVIRTGRIAILAAANNGHYIEALKPTRVVYLRHNGKAEVLTYKEYLDEFSIDAK